MLTLKIDCSNHQKTDEPREFSVMLETIDDTTRQRIERHLRQSGWIVQYNGVYMDTYCSKKCAE